MTAEEFTRKYRIRCVAEVADENTNMGDSKEMDNWKVRLWDGQRQMTLYYSKGVGHHGREPDAAEVLDSLARDAAEIENTKTFDEWATDYGYDTDSREAERIYVAYWRQAAALQRFLGRARYSELLWETERR